MSEFQPVAWIDERDISLIQSHDVELVVSRARRTLHDKSYFTAAQMRQARIAALIEALACAETEAAQGPTGHAYYAIKALIEKERSR